MQTRRTSILTIITVFLLGAVSFPSLASATGQWLDTSNTANGYGTTPPPSLDGVYGTYGPVPREASRISPSSGFPIDPYYQGSTADPYGAGQPANPAGCINRPQMFVRNNLAYILVPTDDFEIGAQQPGPPTEVLPCEFVGTNPDAYSSFDRIWTLDLALGMRYGWNVNLKKIGNETAIPSAQRAIATYYGGIDRELSGSLTAMAVDPATGHDSVYFFGGSVNIDSANGSTYNNRTTYIYDIVTDRWSVKAIDQLPYAVLTAGSATYLNGKIYLIGGLKSTGNGDPLWNIDVYAYDLATNTYAKEGQMAAPTIPYPSIFTTVISNALGFNSVSTGYAGNQNYRMGHRGIPIGGKIYLFGGSYPALVAKTHAYEACKTPPLYAGARPDATDCASVSASLIPADRIEAGRGWAWVYDPVAKAFTSYTAFPGDPGTNNSGIDAASLSLSSAALSADGSTVYSLLDSATLFTGPQYTSGHAMNLPASSITSTLFTLNVSSGVWTPQPMDAKRIIFHSPLAAATADGYVAMGGALCQDDVCASNMDTSPVLRVHANTFWIKFFTDGPTPKLVVEPSTATVNVGTTQQYLAYYYPDETLPGRTDVTNVTNPATWQSANTSIANMLGNGNGLATGISVGSTVATSTYITPQGQTLKDDAIIVVGSLPNLTVGTLKQTSIVVNVATKFSVNVSNIAPVNTGTGFTTSFVVSDSADGSAFKRTFTNVRGASTYLGVNKTFTPTTSAPNSGNFIATSTKKIYVQVCADSTSIITELKEDDNCTPWTGVNVMTASAPDLAAGPTTVTPTTQTTSSSVVFTATTTNGGTAVATPTTPPIQNSFWVTNPSNVTLRWVSGTTLTTLGVLGEALITSASFSTTTPGTYKVRLCTNTNTSGTVGVLSPVEKVLTNNCGLPTDVTVAPSGLPAVGSPTAASVTVATNATLGATVINDGGSALLERGTCWSTTPSPRVGAGTCAAASGTSVGTFTHSRTSITPNTRIYYAGYARNANGYGYSTDGWFENGRCGDANGQPYPGGSTGYAPYVQCGFGNASNTTFPAAGGSQSWTCSGAGTSGSASSVSCSASQGPISCGALSIAAPTATPARVKAGSTSHITWGAASGVTTSCVFTGTNGYTSGPLYPTSCTVSGGSITPDPTINVQTRFCMTCDGNTAARKCVTVNIIPDFTEF